jgi:hypothetical protein
MLPRRAISDLIFVLLALVTLLGAGLTNWLVNVIEQIGASFLHNFVIQAGASITAFVGVGLYELRPHG